MQEAATFLQAGGKLPIQRRAATGAKRKRAASGDTDAASAAGGSTRRHIDAQLDTAPAAGAQPAAAHTPSGRQGFLAARALEKSSRLARRAKTQTWTAYPSGSHSHAVLLTAATVGGRNLNISRETRTGCCLQNAVTARHLPACPPAVMHECLLAAHTLYCCCPGSQKLL